MPFLFSLLPQSSSGVRFPPSRDFLQLPERSSAAPTPATNEWAAYFKNDGLYLRDDAGAESLVLRGGGSPTFDDLTLTGLLSLPSTASDAGMVQIDGDRFLHEGNAGFCTFAGGNAGNFTQTGAGNTGVGALALDALTSGVRNVALGTSALTDCTTGAENVAIGQNALLSLTTGSDNTANGRLAGSSITSGAENCLLGHSAGSELTDETANVMIGYRAGRTVAGEGNVFLGNRAGENSDGDNQLMIANSSTSTPLIAGDFANEFVAIEGNLGLGGDTFGTNAEYTLALANGAAPTTSPSDAFQLYSANASAGNACPHFRTEAGQTIKLYQTASGYTTFANLTTTRTADANSTTIAELADVLGTLIEDLKLTGLIGA